MLNVCSSQNDDIIKKIFNEFKPSQKGASLTENDIRKNLQTINRDEVIKKLNSMGLGNVAQMMSKMSDEDILKRISQNPGILKKLNKLL